MSANWNQEVSLRANWNYRRASWKPEIFSWEMTGLTEKPEKFKKQTETPCWPTEKLETNSFEKPTKRRVWAATIFGHSKHTWQIPTTFKNQIETPWTAKEWIFVRKVLKKQIKETDDLKTSLGLVFSSSVQSANLKTSENIIFWKKVVKKTYV